MQFFEILSRTTGDADKCLFYLECKTWMQSTIDSQIRRLSVQEENLLSFVVLILEVSHFLPLDFLFCAVFAGMRLISLPSQTFRVWFTHHGLSSENNTYSVITTLESKSAAKLDKDKPLPESEWKIKARTTGSYDAWVMIVCRKNLYWSSWRCQHRFPWSASMILFCLSSLTSQSRVADVISRLRTNMWLMFAQKYRKPRGKHSLEMSCKMSCKMWQHLEKKSKDHVSRCSLTRNMILGLLFRDFRDDAYLFNLSPFEEKLFAMRTSRGKVPQDMILWDRH